MLQNLHRVAALVAACAALCATAASAAARPDPQLANQWALQGDGPMGAASAWTRITGGDVTVAVVDTGVDLAHREHQPLDPERLNVGGHDSLRAPDAAGARVGLWHEHPVGGLELAQRLERDVLRIAGPDAHAHQRPAHTDTSRALAAIATRRRATSGVAAQWVCR